MNRTRMLALLAGVAMGAGAAVAQTTDASLERELLADAGARASLQAGGTAGHDGSFYLSDSSGNNRLEIGGYTQFRYTINSRDTTTPDEDVTTGFQHTRAALEFGGNVINENVGFYIRGYFDGEGGSDGGSFSLADAYGTYTFENDVTLMWGQFLAPVTRERMVDERHQLAADRSVTGGVFSPEYTQGIAVSFSNDNFRGVGSFNDGAGTANTSYYSAADNDFALTGRVEFKWQGDWAQFDDFTSFRGTEGYAGMIGGGVHYESSGDTDADPGTVTGGFLGAAGDVWLYTVDASVEGNGWNVFGAFIGRSIDPDAGGADADDFGAIVQGGFFFTEQFEAFARWDALFPDDDVSSDDDYHTLTFGGNYYFVAGSHAAKFTADVQWNLDEAPSSLTGFSTPNHTTGVLSGGGDDQWQLRLQMQLVF